MFVFIDVFISLFVFVFVFVFFVFVFVSQEEQLSIPGGAKEQRHTQFFSSCICIYICICIIYLSAIEMPLSDDWSGRRWFISFAFTSNLLCLHIYPLSCYTNISISNISISNTSISISISINMDMYISMSISTDIWFICRPKTMQCVYIKEDQGAFYVSHGWHFSYDTSVWHQNGYWWIWIQCTRDSRAKYMHTCVHGRVSAPNISTRAFPNVFVLVFVREIVFVFVIVYIICAPVHVEEWVPPISHQRHFQVTPQLFAPVGRRPLVKTPSFVPR